MELASIYLYETKFSENNRFSLEFLTTESNFNVFFNKDTTYYLTNLDANLILGEESNEIETTTYHNNIKKLSELSNKLIKDKYTFDNDTKVNFVYLSIFDNNLSKHDLYLNDDLKDLMSYKYKFLDVKKNKVLDCKIYDPYSHLKAGMEFELDKDIRGKSTYKIQLVKNKLIKRVNFQIKNLTDFWYRYVNCLMKYSHTQKKLVVKFPRYELLENIYKKLNIPTDRKDIFELYYRYIDTGNEIVCHEDNYSKLSADKKSDIVIVALKNKKIRILGKRFIYVPTRNYRGNPANSFVGFFKFNGRFSLSQQYLSAIKTIEPLFPFTSIESYYTGELNQYELDLKENDILRITNNDLNYNPFLYIKSTNSKLAKYFRTSVGILSNQQEVTLNTNEQKKLKELMSEDVDEIKELVKKEEVVESLKPTNKKELKQKHFYLYDNSNFVKSTLVTELNKKINLYGKIEISAIYDSKTIKLINPERALKFRVERSIFKENLNFELQNIVKEEVIKTTDNKIHNINVVMVPQNRKRYTLVDSVKIIGFHSFGVDKLNPISISIENNDLISHFSTEKNYKFRLTINSVLLSSSIKNETEIIHLSAIGLTDARYSLINNKLLKSLGQINLTEIENFSFFKEKKGWINCVLTDSHKTPYSSKHFSYSFITNNLLNILNFEVEFLNKKGERLEWTPDEKKIPSITFTVDILK